MDGIEIVIPRTEVENYYKLVVLIEEEFKINFEHEEYDFIYYKSVNDYIAKTKSGVKKKGLFVTNPELGNSCDELVIAKCLELYFIQDIKPETVLDNPYQYNFTIYDFCLSKKISKDYKVMHNGFQIQQLNRFYISKKGVYLRKLKNTKSNSDSVIANYGVTLFNNYVYYEDFNKYEINKSYYLRKINDIIYDLEKNKIQLSMF